MERKCKVGMIPRKALALAGGSGEEGEGREGGREDSAGLGQACQGS